MIYLVIDNMGF